MHRSLAPWRRFIGSARKKAGTSIWLEDAECEQALQQLDDSVTSGLYVFKARGRATPGACIPLIRM